MTLSARIDDATLEARNTPGALHTVETRPFASRPFRLGTMVRVGAAVLIAALLSAAALLLGRSPGPGQALSLSMTFGALFGFALQRSRFCFFCIFRDWLDVRDPRGLYGLLVALAVGIAGYTLVFGAWLPDPTGGRLPPDAFIGPVSFVLVLAGLAFGVGMAISGSCVSAHLYRLGEGSPTAPFALIGTAAGFVLGFATWNSLYLTTIATAPAVWLPRWLGYFGAMVFALAVLAALAWALQRRAAKHPAPASVAANPLRAVFVERWPAWAGGLAVGAIGVAAYFRVKPLGVTAEIGARARQAADVFALVPQRLEGLDILRGCVTIARDALLTPNGCFVVAMVLASFAAALAAGQFRPSLPTLDQMMRGLLGGILLGWGAMTALGCTVGALLSGIMAGAASGWIFGAAVFFAIAVTLRLGRRLGFLPAR